MNGIGRQSTARLGTRVAVGLLLALAASSSVGQAVAAPATISCDPNAAGTNCPNSDTAALDAAVKQPGQLSVITAGQNGEPAEAGVRILADTPINFSTWQGPIIGGQNGVAPGTPAGERIAQRRDPLPPSLAFGATDDPSAPPLLDDIGYSSGGDVARPGEARWQAQIYQPWPMQRFIDAGIARGQPLWQLQHLCGGVLIARNWILTAAHCLNDADGQRRPGYRIRLGVVDFAQGGGWTYMIDRVVRYPLYSDPPPGSPPRTRYDLALAHFVRDAQSSPYNPPANLVSTISLDDGPPPADGDDVYATGWGVMEGQQPTSVLMKVQMQSVEENRCARLWGTARNSTVICAGAAGRQTCQGDSGGPLVNEGGSPRLIGIVSYNLAQCRGDINRPGVYTRVATPEYSDWIRQTIATTDEPRRP